MFIGIVISEIVGGCCLYKLNNRDKKWAHVIGSNMSKMQHKVSDRMDRKEGLSETENNAVHSGRREEYEMVPQNTGKMSSKVVPMSDLPPTPNDQSGHKLLAQ